MATYRQSGYGSSRVRVTSGHWTPGTSTSTSTSSGTSTTTSPPKPGDVLATTRETSSGGTITVTRAGKVTEKSSTGVVTSRYQATPESTTTYFSETKLSPILERPSVISATTSTPSNRFTTGGLTASEISLRSLQSAAQTSVSTPPFTGAPQPSARKPLSRFEEAQKIYEGEVRDYERTKYKAYLSDVQAYQVGLEQKGITTSEQATRANEQLSLFNLQRFGAYKEEVGAKYTEIFGYTPRKDYGIFSVPYPRNAIENTTVFPAEITAYRQSKFGMAMQTLEKQEKFAQLTPMQREYVKEYVGLKGLKSRIESSVMPQKYEAVKTLFRAGEFIAEKSLDVDYASKIFVEKWTHPKLEWGSPYVTGGATTGFMLGGKGLGALSKALFSAKTAMTLGKVGKVVGGTAGIVIPAVYGFVTLDRMIKYGREERGALSRNELFEAGTSRLKSVGTIAGVAVDVSAIGAGYLVGAGIIKGGSYLTTPRRKVQFLLEGYPKKNVKLSSKIKKVYDVELTDQLKAQGIKRIEIKSGRAVGNQLGDDLFGKIRVNHKTGIATIKLNDKLIAEYAGTTFNGVVMSRTNVLRHELFHLVHPGISESSIAKMIATSSRKGLFVDTSLMKVTTKSVLGTIFGRSNITFYPVSGTGTYTLYPRIGKTFSSYKLSTNLFTQGKEYSVLLNIKGASFSTQFGDFTQISRAIVTVPSIPASEFTSYIRGSSRPNKNLVVLRDGETFKGIPGTNKLVSTEKGIVFLDPLQKSNYFRQVIDSMPEAYKPIIAIESYKSGMIDFTKQMGRYWGKIGSRAVTFTLVGWTGAGIEVPSGGIGTKLKPDYGTELIPRYSFEEVTKEVIAPIVTRRVSTFVLPTIITNPSPLGGLVIPPTYPIVSGLFGGEIGAVGGLINTPKVSGLLGLGEGTMVTPNVGAMLEMGSAYKAIAEPTSLVGVDYGAIADTMTGAKTITRTQTGTKATIYSPSITNIFEVVTPMIPLIPLFRLPDLGGGGDRRLMPLMKPSRKTKYTPSLTAYLLNIKRTKVPKTLTGFGTRPILSIGKKRRKKRRRY